MQACINKNSAEYRALKERSGLSDFQLKIAIGAYQEAHNGAWPHLDEIPKANSEQNIKETLKIKKDGSAKIDDILKATGTDSIEKAILQLNDIYRDVTVQITPLRKEALVDIEKRPSPYEVKNEPMRDLSDLNSTVFINLSLEKLADCYGVQVISKTTSELQNEGILEQVPEGVQAAAFILDGNIIVNTDVANVDAPVHELMHLLLGSLKYTNPEAYYNLVQLARNLSSYDRRAALYPHRAQSDVDEEVFVNEYAKFTVGLPSEFSNLDPEAIYQLNYEMSRVLDTILNGDNSVRAIPEPLRFGSSLKQLGEIVNSKNMESRYKSYVDSAYAARLMANIKEDLFRAGTLEEICN